MSNLKTILKPKELFRPSEYFKPTSVEETVKLLDKYGEKGRLIAGGTDLVVDKDPKIEILIDITGLGLDYIKSDSQGLRIGATTTFADILTSPVLDKSPYNILVQSASRMSTPQIRNMATIGGNICYAMPSASGAIPLIVLSAGVKIVGPGGERVVPVESFFTGLGTTVLKKGEMVVEFQIPVPPPETKGIYLKYSRTAIDMAVVGVAVVITLESGGVCKDIKIALASVASTPVRACSAEEAIKGKKIDEAIIEKCAQVAADGINPRSGSIRASQEYKKLIVKVYTARAIQQLTAK